MNRNRSRLAGLLALVVTASCASAQDKGSRVVLEAYPKAIQERLDLVERQRQLQLTKIGRDKLEGVMEAGRLWKAGSTVTVAFRGGSEDLCGKLAVIANRWTEHGNLKFCFHTADGKVRRWSAGDKEFAADIRLGFDHPNRGYFSLVGTECRDPRIVKPGDASMNLEGFDKDLPMKWQSFVLHEFGHAVGFHHEHQSPVVPCDFRMEDDPGYVQTRNADCEFIPDPQGRRPGVYTRLGGPPNKWSKEDVDANFGQLMRGSRMFLASEFDRDSIMKYDVPSWMYKGGEKSHCYKGPWNTDLSKTDRVMMSKAYPTSAEEIRILEDSIDRFNKLTPDVQVPKK